MNECEHERSENKQLTNDNITGMDEVNAMSSYIITYHNISDAYSYECGECMHVEIS